MFILIIEEEQFFVNRNPRQHLLGLTKRRHSYSLIFSVFPARRKRGIKEV